jgi:hypothetical protein
MEARFAGGNILGHVKGRGRLVMSPKGEESFSNKFPQVTERDFQRF